MERDRQNGLVLVMIARVFLDANVTEPQQALMEARPEVTMHDGEQESSYATRIVAMIRIVCARAPSDHRRRDRLWMYGERSVGGYHMAAVPLPLLVEYSALGSHAMMPSPDSAAVFDVTDGEGQP